MAVFTHVMSYDVDWDKLGTSGRAPRTRETPPDFRESCWVTRHSLVFSGLTGCQRAPGFWGVTTIYNSSRVNKLLFTKHISKFIVLIHVIQNEYPKPQPVFLLNATSSERRPPVHSLYLK